jgi:dienelactone hydrolase
MRLLLIILLFSWRGAHSQVDYFTLTKSSGMLIGMVEHRAPANPSGKLDPVLVWLHGIDANKAQPISVHDTTRISFVTNKGPLRMVRDGTPMPLFQKPGTVSSDERYRWNIVAPQNRTGQWDCECVAKTFDYIRANPTVWDTSLIILVGYSLGGGGARVCATNSSVYPYVKYVVDIAGGYNTSVNYSTWASSAINLDVFATLDDELVTESVPDAFVNSIKQLTPKVVPNYYRFTTVPSTATTNPKHDGIEVFIARDTTTGDTQAMTNGSTWTRTETIYHRGLRFKGPRRLGFYYLLILLFIPLKPLNPSRENEGV